MIYLLMDRVMRITVVGHHCSGNQSFVSSRKMKMSRNIKASAHISCVKMLLWSLPWKDGKASCIWLKDGNFQQGTSTIPISNTNIFVFINHKFTHYHFCVSLVLLTSFSHKVLTLHIVSQFTGFFKNVTPANGKGLL